MANESLTCHMTNVRLIDANEVISGFRKLLDKNHFFKDTYSYKAFEIALQRLLDAPTVDAVEVVRCQNCVHAEPLDRNCEINTCHYMHCKLYRGEETKNVWHKYKKYYKDYSLVERDGFCSDGAKMDGDGNG